MKTDSDDITVYLKSSRDRANQLIVAVNLDPKGPHHCIAEVPLAKVGRASGETYRVTDLLSGARYIWGEKNYVRLDPSFLPAHILFVEKAHET
jgi:starch synthase (maltosyl-transferring)